MKPPLPPDSHHLEAALGWIDLGNHIETDAELRRIKAKNHAPAGHAQAAAQGVRPACEVEGVLGHRQL